MITKGIKYFNLRKIMNSGQIFRMYEPEDGRFIVFSGNRRLEVKQNILSGDQSSEQEMTKVEFGCTEKEFSEYWEEYFDLKRDYGAIVKTAGEYNEKILNDKELNKTEKVRGAEFLRKSCEYGADIRVLKQDIWEMIISFIISQQKQIPSIRKCIEALCERFGEKHETWYGFPTAESIASAGPEGLKGLSLGYRERYIYETAVKYLTDGITKDELEKMPAAEVKKYLTSFTGIGDKVADCICLFGVGLVDSFPIDVHIKDILYREFVSDKDKRKKTEQVSYEISRKKLLDSLSYNDYMKIIDDNFSAFNGVKGIIQQWIFAYEIAKQ
ncbi:MAG: hypothetical protein IKW90_07360 [Lachnospiraceae bacterium]|nr:hypothetical protein [Lachnospiraceae bacterium]